MNGAVVRRIARHEIDLEFAARQVEGLGKGVDQWLARVERFPESMDSLFDMALMRAFYRCALDPEAKQGPTWESVIVAMQAGSCLFAAAVGQGESVECTLDAEVKTLQVTGARSWTHAGTWLRAFWLALICRERERVDLLCGVPVDLLRASEMGARVDEYIYPWVGSLQGFWNQDPGYFDLLTEALRGTDPEVLQVASEEFILLVMYPPIKMFNYLVGREEGLFNDALAEALELHRSYWTNTPERAKKSDGFVALGPTALACLAKEMGMAIEVESEYMPQVLLDGGWVGEFST